MRWRPRRGIRLRGGPAQSRKAPLGDAVQQLPLLAVPPLVAQSSALVTEHDVVAQSASVVQLVPASSPHTPPVQIPAVATTQATAPRLPQLERAAQGTSPRAHRRFTPAARAASRAACATQRTYWPWFFQPIVPPLPSSTPAQGQVMSTNAWITLDAASHAFAEPPPPLP